MCTCGSESVFWHVPIWEHQGTSPSFPQKEKVELLVVYRFQPTSERVPQQQKKKNRPVSVSTWSPCLEGARLPSPRPSAREGPGDCPAPATAAPAPAPAPEVACQAGRHGTWRRNWWLRTEHHPVPLFCLAFSCLGKGAFSHLAH